jgi:hypothetical protein
MATKVIELDDIILMEAKVPEHQSQPISGEAADNVNSILVKLSRSRLKLASTSVLLGGNCPKKIKSITRT